MKIDQLIRSRRKTIALIIDKDGRLVVRAPNLATLTQIQSFVDDKADWIRLKRESALQQKAAIPDRKFSEGEMFPYLGQDYALKFVDQQAQVLCLNGKFSIKRSAQPKAKQAFENWYKKQARELFAERAARYSQKYGFRYQNIRIKNARTRWGSCSTKGNLNFNWRLVMAPLEILDYVVVHELVHLKYPNHSPEFWEGVRTILPDYKIRRQWLKSHASQLHW